MMKKLLCMLLAAMMLLGCAAFAEAVDYIGMWTLTGAEMAGTPIDLSLIGLEMSMDLREDGTCTLTTMGETEEGTWTADAAGAVVTDAHGEPQVFTMVDDKMEANQEGMKIIFSRAGDAASFVGKWVMTGMVANGVEMGTETMSMFGLTLTLTLNEDGTCVVDGMGQKESGTWTATPAGVAITDPTETLEFAYVDDMLVMDDAGSRMMLTREGAAPAIVEKAAAAPVMNVPAEAFEGTWELTSANVFGMDITAADMGVTMSFDLAAGAGTYLEGDDTSLYEVPITYTVTDPEGEPTLLTLLYQDETLTEPMELLVLNMLDDGRLLCAIEMDGMEISYYFTAVVEEVPAE